MVFDTLTVVTICLAISFVFSELFFRFRYPRVIGQILAGVILGIPLLKALFSPEILLDIKFLADLGIIFLLLLTGLKLNIEKFKKAEKDTFIIAIFSVVVPFILGFILMKAMGYSYTIAFVVGACFSLTAEGTKLKVLFDMNALNTKLGVIMLGAGILDDVFEVLFLSIVLVLTHKSMSALAYLPLKILLFIIIVYLTYKLFPKILAVIRREHSRIATFSFILLFALIVAVVSTKLDFGPIIGAFIAGIIISIIEHKKGERKEIVEELEAMTFAFIIPFFFINIGLHFDFSSLTQNTWLIVMVIIIATLGKLLGAIMATPFTDLSLKQTHLIGWGMNSRGAIELVIAEVARVNGLIPIEIYSAIVVMAVVTTMAFPLVIKAILNKDNSILN